MQCVPCSEVQFNAVLMKGVVEHCTVQWSSRGVTKCSGVVGVKCRGCSAVKCIVLVGCSATKCSGGAVKWCSVVRTVKCNRTVGIHCSECSAMRFSGIVGLQCSDVQWSIVGMQYSGVVVMRWSEMQWSSGVAL